MFENIVVPLDRSKLAEIALPYAEELAARMGSDVVLLTCVESEEAREMEKYYLYITRIKNATKRHAQKYIQREEEKAVNVTIATQPGDPAEGILEYAGKSSFPLIVMASHGKSGISRWAVGSVADKVVRDGDSHLVMLIRANETHSDIREKRLLKKGLVPLDGSFRSEAVLPYITNIAYKAEMDLTILRVVPETDQAKTDAEAYLKNICEKITDIADINLDYKVGVGPVAETIIDLADEMTVDLVAMSTRGMNRKNPLSLGSVAQKVFLGGNTPLLLIKK
ncbi:universal stress protein [Chloroflexota bacterium]